MACNNEGRSDIRAIVADSYLPVLAAMRRTSLGPRGRFVKGAVRSGPKCRDLQVVKFVMFGPKDWIVW